MGVSRSICLNDINEGSCGICCGRRRISPLNVRIASRGNANIAIGEHGRSSYHMWKNPREPIPQMHL